MLLSVSAAVSVKFENKVFERLSWLEGVLAVLDPMVIICPLYLCIILGIEANVII